MDNRYKWENDKEYNYRICTSKLSNEIKLGLTQIVGQAQMKIPNYVKAINIFSRLLKALEGSNVPEIYMKVNGFLLTGVECYLAAAKNLQESTKVSEGKAKHIYKAQALINEGNCWVEISKIRIAEAVEICESR
ncbi:MAG: hypothetical protein ABF289_18400 [Clostridiales bacterium]